MQNSHVERIKTIDAQLKALDKITASGEYRAAGLTIHLTVGEIDDHSRTLEIGLCDNLDTILDSLKTGLQQARQHRVSLARGDLRDLQAFFETEGGAA